MESLGRTEKHISPRVERSREDVGSALKLGVLSISKASYDQVLWVKLTRKLLLGFATDIEEDT